MTLNARNALLGVMLTAAVGARAGGDHRLNQFRADWDRRLADRWTANDRAAVLDGVDEVALRLPNDPLAGLWLAAVMSAEGAPEAADDLASRWRSTGDDTAAARAWATERARLREITVVVTGSSGVTLDGSRRRKVEDRVGAWLATWARAPEEQGGAPTPSATLLRARHLASQLFALRPSHSPVVEAQWVREGYRVRLVRGPGRLPTSLEIDLGDGTGRAFVASEELASANAPVTVAIGSPGELDAAGASVDRVAVAGWVQLISVDPGTRWRRSAREAWQPLSTKVSAPTAAGEFVVEVEQPRRERQALTLVAVPGTTAVEVPPAPLRRAWIDWEAGGPFRAAFAPSFVLPAVLGLGSVTLGLLGATADAEARTTLGAYEDSRNLVEAAELRAAVERKGNEANLFAGGALAAGAVAVLSTAVPVWLFLQSEWVEPPDFDDGHVDGDGGGADAGENR